MVFFSLKVGKNFKNEIIEENNSNEMLNYKNKVGHLKKMALPRNTPSPQKKKRRKRQTKTKNIYCICIAVYFIQYCHYLAVANSNIVDEYLACFIL